MDIERRLGPLVCFVLYNVLGSTSIVNRNVQYEQACESLGQKRLAWPLNQTHRNAYSYV